MTNLKVLISVDDNLAAEEGLSVRGYVEREFGWLAQSGISLRGIEETSRPSCDDIYMRGVYKHFPVLSKAELAERVAELKLQEKSLDCKMDFDVNSCIDENHLHAYWYGGRVGSITFANGYKVVIIANGELRCEGIVNGCDFSFVDKSGSGKLYDELGGKITDIQLLDLLGGEQGKGDYLFVGSNSWFEFDIVTPEGKFIDVYDDLGVDNVLDDNILECFENIESYLDVIEDCCIEGGNNNA